MYSSDDMSVENSPKCIIGKVNYLQDDGHVTLSSDEDTRRLCRLANAYLEDDGSEDEEQETESEPTQLQAAGPLRLESVSSSGKRTTRFVLR